MLIQVTGCKIKKCKFSEKSLGVLQITGHMFEVLPWMMLYTEEGKFPYLLKFIIILKKISKILPYKTVFLAGFHKFYTFKSLFLVQL